VIKADPSAVFTKPGSIEIARGSSTLLPLWRAIDGGS
jgi:hypothetical protein